MLISFSSSPYVLVDFVTNYHVVAKLATDTSGLQRCKVFLADTKGNSFYREGKAIEFDPAYDLAVLKVTLKRTWTKMPLLHRTKLLCWNIV
ncbi:protease Do-like 5, chloroplastic isoform X3 [Lotus japonicus]|uniref:protease Do-like 5, chloroplastic isoform X3 n=1 Tax=Lotus japonicus TaxID=34305 RepID=UPI0025826A4D|nr:protease Do-like 5, chloroplastic isoform X3 [Lotus japonicus]